MIIITGGAGFIGSNLLEKLNRVNYDSKIIIFDNKNKKKNNIKNLKYSAFYHKDEIFSFLKTNKSKIDIIFHLGACTNTLEKNWDYLLKNNFLYTKKLAIYCARQNIRLIYASSASVYGKLTGIQDEIKNINDFKPLNLYAKSKLKFDKFLIKNFSPNAKIIGLRYFNVYGNKEGLKKNMSSPVHNFTNQIINSGHCKIFGEFDNFKSGDHKRDFVYVKDCVNLNNWLFKKKFNKMNILNVGAGYSTSFKNIAREIIHNLGYGEIKYIEFPNKLKKGYQSYTCANLKRLKKIGYKFKFTNPRNGIKEFLQNYNIN